MNESPCKALLAAALAAPVLLQGCNRPEPDTAPEAMWRDGLIVEIRGCDPPPSSDHELLCAQLRCTQAVTRQLVNPAEARAVVTDWRRMDTNAFEMGGRIDYRTSISQPLPRRFECRLQGRRLEEVRLHTPMQG